MNIWKGSSQAACPESEFRSLFTLHCSPSRAWHSPCLMLVKCLIHPVYCCHSAQFLMQNSHSLLRSSSAFIFGPNIFVFVFGGQNTIRSPLDCISITSLFGMRFFWISSWNVQISHPGKGFDDWEVGAHPPSAALIRPFTPSPISSAASHLQWWSTQLS